MRREAAVPCDKQRTTHQSLQPSTDDDISDDEMRRREKRRSDEDK